MLVPLSLTITIFLYKYICRCTTFCRILGSLEALWYGLDNRANTPRDAPSNEEINNHERTGSKVLDFRMWTILQDTQRNPLDALDVESYLACLSSDRSSR